MNVTYIGFGGTMDVPCYKDEKGNLYFDVNDGKNGLNLYSGASPGTPMLIRVIFNHSNFLGRLLFERPSF